VQPPPTTRTLSGNLVVPASETKAPTSDLERFHAHDKLSEQEREQFVAHMGEQLDQMLRQAQERARHERQIADPDFRTRIHTGKLYPCMRLSVFIEIVTYFRVCMCFFFVCFFGSRRKLQNQARRWSRSQPANERAASTLTNVCTFLIG
jgi:hypothetical protein